MKSNRLLRLRLSLIHYEGKHSSKRADGVEKITLPFRYPHKLQARQPVGK